MNTNASKYVFVWLGSGPLGKVGLHCAALADPLLDLVRNSTGKNKENKRMGTLPREENWYGEGTNGKGRRQETHQETGAYIGNYSLKCKLLRLLVLPK